jgi:hypothetical protein
MPARALLFAFALVLLAPAAGATKCPIPSFEQALAAADVVLVGRAVRHVDGRDTELAVERVYKGEAPARVIARFHGVKYAMLAPPERFLVYAVLEQSADRPGTLDLTVRVCGGSKPTSAADDDLAKLGAGRPPGSVLASAAVDAGVPTPSPPDAAADAAPRTPIVDAGAEPAPIASAAGTPPPAEPGRSGCAGCAAARRAAPHAAITMLLAVIAALVTRRARRT